MSFGRRVNYTDDILKIKNKDKVLAKKIKEFKKLLAEDQLPMLNMDNVNELVKKAKLNVLDQKLKPNPANGDNGNDDGLNEEIDNIQL